MVPSHAVAQLANAGKIKPIAVIRSTRSPLLPKVPTLKEQGFAPVLDMWFGVVAPKGTPPEIVQTLANELTRIVNDADFHSKVMEPQSFEPYTLSPAQFASMLKQERQDVIKLLNDRHIKAD